MAGGSRIDRCRVTLETQTELLYWETKIGASPVAIAMAIARVGSDPGAVRAWLCNRQLARMRVGDEDPLATT
jgi:hypothetical protein